MSDDPRWEPPGPGQWYYSAEHLPGPTSTLFAELFPQVSSGWSRGADRYGLPPDDGGFGPVWRFLYYSPGPPSAEPLDAREELAAAVLSEERWRADIAEWAAVVRPAVMAANRALAAEDPATFAEGALAADVERAIDGFLRWAPEHFAVSVPQALAVGVLLATAQEEWSLEPPAVIEALAGGAGSTSSGADLLERIAGGLRAAGHEQVTDLDAIRAVGGDAAQALDELITDFGWRAFDKDTGPTLAERPEAIVASIRAAGTASGRARPGSDRLAALRAQVPTGDRDRFDDLAAVARSAYGFNDDNTVVLYSVPLGLLRRALLEVGRRCTADGRLDHRDDVFEATRSELRALLAGRGPTATALAARRLERLQAALEEPPPAVGVPVAAPPADLPPAMARLVQLREAWWSAAAGGAAGAAAATVGTEVVRGRALVVDDPVAALLRLEPGDVLVASTTHATYNTIFPLVAAVAVEHGTATGHAAILARELRLPAVIGVPGLLGRVREGDLVEIDPTAGTVTVVG